MLGTGTNRAYAVDVFDGSPTFDRNNDNVLTVDERSQDLRQSGIAPETAFLFPAHPRQWRRPGLEAPAGTAP